MPYNQGLHRFAVALAVATFLLLLAGGLVTSNDAGLAVPDWPTSFGHWPISYHYWARTPMAGGILYEHGHRMVAQIIGMMTIVLAVWMQRREARAWMRKLGWATLAMVIGQGILGGITVLNFLPWAVSTAHATLAQSFFCLTVALALFTSRGWMEGEPLHIVESRHPRLNVLAFLCVLALYVQLILGAAFRHSGMKLLPHIISAVVVAALLVWTVTRVLSEHATIPELRRPAMVALWLLLLQLSLGFAAYLTRVEWGRDAPQPLLPMVVSTVAHLGVGALLLASAVVLALQSRRHFALRPLVVLAHQPHKTVAV